MAAQKQVDQAKAEKEQADKALETAKASQAAADQAVVDAQKAYDTCKAATDKATTAEAQSVIGFYQFIGANDAANIIYRQSDKNPTTVGDKKDGTSLDNAKLSFNKLREINEYRKSVGLSELKVTAEQMAIAQSDSNYSDATKGHSDYAGFENAAWNFSTKENIAHQWVDGEKKIFDDAAAKAGLGNVAPKDAWKTFWSHGTEFGAQGVGFGTVGHYLNIVQPNAKTMGYGINSRGTLWPYVFVLEIDNNYGSYEKEYSIDELENLFDQYQLSLSKASEKLAAAKTDLEQKRSTAASKANAVKVTETLVAQKQEGVDTANSNLAAKNDSVASAAAAVALAEQNLAKANGKVTEAEDQVKAAQSNVATAEQVVNQKRAELKASQEQAAQSQKKVDDAKAETLVKQQALQDAKKELAKYSADVAAAQEKADKAHQTLDKTMVAQASAQSALEKAKIDETAKKQALGTAKDNAEAKAATAEHAASVLTAAKNDFASKKAHADALSNAADNLATAEAAKKDADAAVTEAGVALGAANDAIANAEQAVENSQAASDAAVATLGKLKSINVETGIATGSDANANDTLNVLFAKCVVAKQVELNAKVALDAAQADLDGATPAYTAALSAYNEAKAKRVAAEQALKDEIARQEQEAAKAEQAKITQAAAKPVAGKPSAGNAKTAANSALPTTGDNAALAGETFVIGGVVLVAAGVFLTDKKRRQE